MRNGNQNYVYDPVYQLTSVTGAQTHSYAYDKLGNRTAGGASYTANNLNQYVAVGTATFSYDSNGDLASDGTAAYAYDEENRLSQVVKGGVTSTYTYDAFNRRVSKTVGGVGTYFVHDGQDIAGTLVADYVYGPRIDEPLTMTRAGSTYYYFTDGLGTVRDITNSTGTKIELYDYDPYGKPTTVSTIGNPIMFTGRWYDAESGNYYYRARQYSPTIGRFLQRDPIGYYDSLSLYVYVFNNLTNYTDSLGLLGGVNSSDGRVSFSAWNGEANLYEAFSNNPANLIDPSGLLAEAGPFPVPVAPPFPTTTHPSPVPGDGPLFCPNIPKPKKVVCTLEKV